MVAFNVDKRMSDPDTTDEETRAPTNTEPLPGAAQLMKTAQVEYRDFDVGITVDVKESHGRTYRWVHCFAHHAAEDVRLGCLDDEILGRNGLTQLVNSPSAPVSVDEQVTRAVQQIKQSIDWWHDGTTADHDVERAARAGFDDSQPDRSQHQASADEETTTVTNDS